MSGAVKKYIVVCDGFEIEFREFSNSPEEAVANSEFDFTGISDRLYVIEVTKPWEVKQSPRIVEEDNQLFFLGSNIPQKKPVTRRK